MKTCVIFSPIFHCELLMLQRSVKSLNEEANGSSYTYVCFGYRNHEPNMSSNRTDGGDFRTQTL